MAAREIHGQQPAPRRVLVIGGTSEIAAAIVAELPPDAAREVVLAGRDPAALAAAASAMRTRGAARAETVEVDADDPAGHRAALSRAFELMGGVDLAILAVGLLGARGGLPEDIPAAVEVLRVNTVGARLAAARDGAPASRAGQRHDRRPLVRRRGAPSGGQRRLLRVEGRPGRARAGARR